VADFDPAQPDLLVDELVERLARADEPVPGAELAEVAVAARGRK
jgi:hypothetical protein